MPSKGENRRPNPRPAPTFAIFNLIYIVTSSSFGPILYRQMMSAVV